MDIKPKLHRGNLGQLKSEKSLPKNITKDLSHRYQFIFRNKEKVREITNRY